MLDKILGWAVIWLPIALSVAFIFVPARSEDEQQNMRWRYWLVAAAVLLGALSWWQQSRAIRTSAKDREDAIKETSKEVATETSKQVTKVLTEQYTQMIDQQKTQIADLQGELKAQARDVSAIKGSNIVTGKNPLKVEVINPNLPAKEAHLPGINWTQVQREALNGIASMNIRFAVEENLDIPAFVVVCDRACAAVHALCNGVGTSPVFIKSSSPSVTGVIFKSPRPLSRGTECSLQIASADSMPIKVTEFRILREMEIPVELR